MSEYTRKIVEELFRINEERKAELANMEIDIDKTLVVFDDFMLNLFTNMCYSIYNIDW